MSGAAIVAVSLVLALAFALTVCTLVVLRGARNAEEAEERER